MMLIRKVFVVCIFTFFCGATFGDDLYKDGIPNLEAFLNARPDTNTINNYFALYQQTREANPLLGLECLQKAIDIAEVIDNREKTAKLLYHKGYLYRQMGIYNLAALCYVKSLEIYDQLKDNWSYAWLMIDIGNLYLDQRINLNASLDHFKKAKNIFVTLQDQEGIIVSDYCIGQIYLLQKDYEHALSSFKNAAELSNKINMPKHEIIALSLLGETYQRSGKTDKAFEVYNSGLKISNQTNNLDGAARLYNNIADAYESLGNFSESISNYTKALQAYLSIQDKFKTTITLNEIGKLYYSQGKTEKAIEYAQKALAVADSNNLVNQQEVIIPLLVEYFSKTKNTEDAFPYLKRYMTLKESNINKNALQIQHEYELQLDKKEKLLSEEKVKKQQMITYLSVGSVFVFFLLAGLLFRQHKKLKASYRHLYDNYQTLSKKEEEIEDIKKQTKYVSSSLKDQQQQALVEKINKLMQEKIYVRKDLNLDALADELGTNRTYLSQVINDQYNSNFNNFINEHRVKEAQKLLLNPDQKLWTIEAIAQNAGFNSKSSFNSAFKKITGLTPTDFLEMHEGKS